ncbi:MAG: SHOCT domain-containing protein [Anaerolineae bacterium]
MMFGGGMFLGLIFLILFLVLIGGLIVGAIWLVSRSTGSSGLNLGQRTETSTEDPLDILRRRYARGEITREEYQSMREDLMV